MAGKSHRGFGAMEKEKQRQIASKGGKAAHQKGTAHEFTPEEARAAGRKGGQAAHQKGTAHQFTPQEAAAAGRKGGRAAHHRGRASQPASQQMPMQPQTHKGPASYGAPAPEREPSLTNRGHPGGNPNGPGLTMPAHPEAVVAGPVNACNSDMESHPEPRMANPSPQR